MDTRSLQTAPILAESTKHIKLKTKKLSKKEKKLLKKKRKFLKSGKKGRYWEPIDKTNSITLHLVHRSTNDPLLNLNDTTTEVSEWVLEPEVNNRKDFERVQRFFSDFELEDTIPHNYRTDEFIAKTSAQSMPILPSYILNRNNYNYNYEQHYRSINDSYFQSHKNIKNVKNTKNDNSENEILEQYIFEQDYESDFENIETDKNYTDYMDLLMSDDEYKSDDNNSKITGDLQDNFVFEAMGMEMDQNEFKRTQIGTFEPYGARFAKWNEMDIHYDKYKHNNNNSNSLYDQTINHLKNIQTAKENHYFLDDIAEEEDPHQFDDAEEDDIDSMEQSGDESIAYNPEMSLLDNQFEIMLNKEYNDEYIGELDDDLDELRGDFSYAIRDKFTNKNKKESLRYQYYMYLKKKKRRIRQSLKRNTREATLRLMGVNEVNDNDDDDDEIIFFSDSDSELKKIGVDDVCDDKKEIDVMDLDSDDERRINAEINEEFKKKESPKWDCESILSTRTNHENHPIEIKVNVNVNKKNKKDDFYVESVENEVKNASGIEDMGGDDGDVDVAFSFGNIGGDNGDDIVKESDGKQIIFEFTKFDDVKNGNIEDLMGDCDVNEADDGQENDVCVVSAYSNRKGESKEEKRLRKKLQKEMKQQRRKEKKANKCAFKQAKKKQTKLSVTQKKSHGNAIRL